METGPLTAAPESPVEISIILPAFQEEQGIAPLLERLGAVMEPLGRPWEVIVVDDGSTDGTAERAREKGARVVSHPYNIGNGAAVKTGIREARGRVIVMMDADGQHDPADIPRLLEHVGTHDMVVGARTKESETSLHRDLANMLYNGFLDPATCTWFLRNSLTAGYADWTFGYGVTYQGEFHLNNNSLPATNPVTNPTPAVLYVAPDYVTHRAMVGYQVNDALSLQLNIDNLSDTQYFTRIRNNGWATPGAARSATLTAAFRF